MGVAAGGEDLEDAVLEAEDGDVEGAAAEVVDGDDAFLALVEAVGKGSGGGCCAKKAPDAPKKAVDGSFFPCSGLKTVKLEAKAVMADFTPVVLVPFQPDFVLPLPATNLDSSVAHYSRARPRADFVFQPEVSLGAALRSLAPPVLA